MRNVGREHAIWIERSELNTVEFAAVAVEVPPVGGVAQNSNKISAESARGSLAGVAFALRLYS